MNKLGFEKTATMRRLLKELSDIVTVFLNYTVTHFAPVAIFMLITRTFATYGIEYLKPAVVYMVVTVILLLVYLFIGYPIYVVAGTRLNPIIFYPQDHVGHSVWFFDLFVGCYPADELRHHRQTAGC